MICNPSLERLVIYYRIFNDYFGVPMDIIAIKKVVHHLNLYFVKNYLTLVLCEHPIMIDPIDFDRVKSEVEKNPIKLGRMPLSDSESCDWTIWEETSIAEREYFIQMMSKDWLDDDMDQILVFDYQTLLEDEEQILYFNEQIFTKFLFEWDYRGLSYDNYKLDLESRKKVEIRNQLLNKLL